MAVFSNSSVHCENGRFVVTMDAAALAVVGDGLKQQLRLEAVETHITHFVQNKQISLTDTFLKFAQNVVVFGFGQR